jgi:hypothetical protein
MNKEQTITQVVATTEYGAIPAKILDEAMRLYERLKLWEIAPDWVQYIAVDADGHAWGFDKKPTINCTWGCWMNPDGWSECLSLTENSTDWENSLQERPLPA